MGSFRGWPAQEKGWADLSKLQSLENDVLAAAQVNKEPLRLLESFSLIPAYQKQLPRGTPSPRWGPTASLLTPPHPGDGFL